MSVFTSVDRNELELFLGDYDLGKLETFAGIESGIENTNYFVTTSRGRYVLTLFELTPARELGYFLNLMAHLAESDVVSAHPIGDRTGNFLRTLKNKPAALVIRLPGASVERPNVVHCAAIGTAMARMHRAAANFVEFRANDRGPEWRRGVVDLLRPHVTPTVDALLDRVLANDARIDWGSGLPTGVIHADLFRDNALFEGERLSGIIDFYYAHNGPFVYDLAVCVADWCFSAAGFDSVRARALVGAYHAVRPLLAAERQAWTDALSVAAARFWLSRLKDRTFPRHGALTHTKDPEPFRRVLIAALERPDLLRAAWPT